MDTKFSKLTGVDKGIKVFAYVILGLFMAAIIFPVIYIILASFIDPITLQNHGLTFDFSKWTLTAYERVMTNDQIWIGFKNAMIYSVLFTIISVAVTLLAAYPMSRPDFKGKGLLNTLFVITMFFGGGLIPTYLLISNLGMLDTMWAVLIPGAFSVWNMIIAKSFMKGIPFEITEAAKIDGAGDFYIYLRIILPMAKPLVATLTLFIALAYWNDWYNCMLFMSNSDNWNLQYTLQNILNSSEALKRIANQTGVQVGQMPSEGLKLAMTVIATGPIVLLYPFLQKYFVKGLTLGAVKG